jgi:hypothetical protein
MTPLEQIAREISEIESRLIVITRIVIDAEGNEIRRITRITFVSKEHT